MFNKKIMFSVRFLLTRSVFRPSDFGIWNLKKKKKFQYIKSRYEKVGDLWGQRLKTYVE